MKRQAEVLIPLKPRLRSRQETWDFSWYEVLFCQDEYGQIAPVYSISAGLDYPGVGPEHAYLHDMGRAEYVPVTDEEAVWAFEYLAKTEGDHSGDRIGACSCSCNESRAVDESGKDNRSYDFRQRR